MKNQNQDLKSEDISYFHLNLLSYLRAYHPDKADDLVFISERGELASHAYSDAVKQGFNQLQAGDIANLILFQGLLFSPFSTLLDVLWDEFPEIIITETASQEALRLLPLCQPIFSKYELNDDFEQTPEYDKLYLDLVGIIQMLVEDEL